MTNQVIPVEAVEAAAKAIYECQPLHGFPSGEVISWDDLTAGAFAKRGLMVEQARSALAATTPYTRSAWHDAVSDAYVEGALSADQANVMWAKNPYR